MTRLHIGVMLPVFGADSAADIPDVRATARHAEALGFDSVWVGDHLATGAPTLESTITLATAAAVTERVGVGLAVFVPALRPVAWAAKQIATLQHLSGGRLTLGVGSGGPWPEEWDAAGVPYRERGRRTDAALAVLPRLIAGEPTRLDDLPGQPVVTLAPGVAPPPIWIGGSSDAALRRVATYGDGWLPSLVTRDDVAEGAARLREMAAERGRPAPAIAVGIVVALGKGASAPSKEEIARDLVEGYGFTPERAAAVPVVGTPSEAAERFMEYAAAGATHLVAGLYGTDWQRQWELLAEAQELLG
ncbi:LLM class flavin-dependent oxidoreductase [Sphaerobacter thermophilus]|uniref:LLM class flavin-dependent oxidoreductase n=1 Tax=Sphaerobacter thermophilus TaxID=2057 RepID=UPI00396F1068